MAYLDERLRPRREWYDAQAVRAKALHLSLDYTAGVVSILLIALAHVHEVPRWGVSVLALVVALAIAVEKIGKFGEKWILYRLSAEALESEAQLFLHGAGPYAGTTTPKEQMLVERTEQLLRAEAGRWQTAIGEPRIQLEGKIGSS